MYSKKWRRAKKYYLLDAGRVVVGMIDPLKIHHHYFITKVSLITTASLSDHLYLRSEPDNEFFSIYSK